MSTIENLYYGNIYPFEHKTEPDSKEKELLKLLCRNEENLTKFLKKEQIDEFEKYKDNQVELSGLIERKAFAKGFILAVRLMSEAMQINDTEEM